MDPTSLEFIIMVAAGVALMGGIFGIMYWVLYQTQHWYGTEDGYFPVNFSEDDHDWFNPDTGIVMVDVGAEQNQN